MQQKWLAALVFISLALPHAFGADEPGPLLETPDVEKSIPASVKALGKPAAVVFPTGIQMAISTKSEEAQADVLQGLNHLHGGWEFEASRHFAEAMRKDPDCLLAYWGMMMCLINPSPETIEARNAAGERMLELLDQGAGTELERGYAYGLMKYLNEGPAGAASAFRKVADKFPNELQAGVFAALFNRGGYDAAGDATPDQAAAEKRLLELIAKHPQSPIPINALLLIRAEAPDLSGSVALARKLCQMQPDYAPFFHLLGHYEWRCGNHKAAAAAFGRASTFYQKWMAENKVAIADCPEWVKAECYRIVSLVSKGDIDTGIAAAKQVAGIPVPKGRLASPGARFLLWDAKTLPACILLRRGQKGDAEAAALSLPKPDEIKPLRQHTLAHWWIDGLRLAIDARRLIDAGDLTKARDVVTALSQHGEMMTASQARATANGERSQWTRSFRALEVLASDLRGRLALAGPANMRGTAYNWFSSAADRQQASPLMMPPLILSPMASRLGTFFLLEKKNDDAVEAYQRALTAFPNDMDTLAGLLTALEAAGKSDEAAKIRKQIADLKAE